MKTIAFFRSTMFICVLCAASVSCSESDGSAQSAAQQAGSEAAPDVIDALRRPVASVDLGTGPDGPEAGTSYSDYIALSLRYYDEGNFEKAIDASLKSLQLNPSRAVPYNNICVAYIQLKDYDRAALACSKAIDIDPDFTLAQNNLAWVKRSRTRE